MSSSLPHCLCWSKCVCQCAFWHVVTYFTWYISCLDSKVVILTQDRLARITSWTKPAPSRSPRKKSSENFANQVLIPMSKSILTLSGKKLAKLGAEPLVWRTARAPISLQRARPAAPKNVACRSWSTRHLYYLLSYHDNYSLESSLPNTITH